MLKLQYFGHLMWIVNSLEKTLMLGKTEGRTRRGTTKDEMVGWHHWLNGHDFEQTPGNSEGQGSLACCSPWGRKELGHDLATEKQQRILCFHFSVIFFKYYLFWRKLKDLFSRKHIQNLMLQYFGHLVWTADSLENTRMLEKIKGGRRQGDDKGDDRGWDGWMASLTQWTWLWINSRT